MEDEQLNTPETEQTESKLTMHGKLRKQMKMFRPGSPEYNALKDQYQEARRVYNRAAQRKSRETARLAKEISSGNPDKIEGARAKVLEARRKQEILNKQQDNLNALAPEERAALDKRVRDFESVRATMAQSRPDKALAIAREFSKSYPAPSPERAWFYYRTYGLAVDSVEPSLDSFVKWYTHNRYALERDWSLADELVKGIEIPTERLNDLHLGQHWIRLYELRGNDVEHLLEPAGDGWQHVYVREPNGYSHYVVQPEPSNPIYKVYMSGYSVGMVKDVRGNEVTGQSEAQAKTHTENGTLAAEVSQIVNETPMQRLEKVERMTGVPASWQV